MTQGYGQDPYLYRKYYPFFTESYYLLTFADTTGRIKWN